MKETPLVRQTFSGLSPEPVSLAVNLMTLLILVTIGRVQEFIPGLIGLPLAKVLIVFLLILVLQRRNLEPSQPFSHPQIKSFMLLFALACLSVVTSRWPSMSFQFMKSDYLSVALFVFFLIKVCISWQTLWRISWSLVAAAMILSLTTLAKKVEGRAWITGSAYDPNDLAFIIVVLLPFFYFMAKNIKSLIVRAILFFGMGVLVVTILMTQSRGGLIGLMIISGAILLHEKVRPLPVILVGCSLFIILSMYAPTGYWDRVANIGNSEKDYNMDDQTGRIAVWKRGIGFMLESPLLGVGPCAFSVADGESRLGAGKWSVAHNSFVQVGAELGVTGLILFISMIASSLRTVRAVRSELPPGTPEIGLLCAIEVGFYGYISAGFFLSQAYATVLYLLVGMSAVAANLAWPKGRPACP